MRGARVLCCVLAVLASAPALPARQAAAGFTNAPARRLLFAQGRLVCVPCPAGTYKAAAGSAGCLPCPGAGPSRAGSASRADCMQPCATPAATSTGTANFARMCGPSFNASCAAAASSTLDDSELAAAAAVDGDLGTRFHTECTGSPEWFRVDLGVRRKIASVTITQRTGAARLSGSLVKVGDADAHAAAGNAQCAALPSISADPHTAVVACDAEGRFLFVTAEDCILFDEIQVFGPCACPARQHAPRGGGACAACPAGTTSAAGGACQCRANFFRSDGVCAACAAGTTSPQGALGGASSCVPPCAAGQAVPRFDDASFLASALVPARGGLEFASLATRAQPAPLAADIDVAGAQGYQRTVAYQQRAHAAAALPIPHPNHIENRDTFRLVRFLPAQAAAGRWHDATDDLLGSHAAYGAPHSFAAQWSRAFPRAESSEMLVARADFSHWVRFPRASLDATYTDAAQDVLATSADGAAHTIRWDNRGSGNAEDPRIKVSDAVYVYSEAGSRETSGYMLGSLVFVRGASAMPAARPAGAADMPTAGAGPPAALFAGAAQQYLDGGPRTFNLDGNGGFTAVAVLRFAGAPLQAEPVFDFGSAGLPDIALARTAAAALEFSVWNRAAGDRCSVTTAGGAGVPSAQWLTVVLRYRRSSRGLSVRVSGAAGFRATGAATCATARTDRAVANTLVGRSNGAAPLFLTAAVAGLYAVDAELSAGAVAGVVASFAAGTEPLDTCAACPPGEGSLAGGPCGVVPTCLANAQPTLDLSGCECSAGYTGAPAACSACPAREYKALAGPQACAACPDAAPSPPGSASLAACMQLCAAPAATSTGTANVARTCGAAGTGGACPALLSHPQPDSAFGAAGVAVDGVRAPANVDAPADAFRSAGAGVDEWWRVDFGAPRRILRVDIQNRQDATAFGVIDGAVVRIGDSEAFAANTQCGSALSGAKAEHTVTCDLVGRFLYVVLPSLGPLQFAELEAFGPCACPAGQYAPAAGGAACAVCPAGFTSLTGAEGLGACGCPAGGYAAPVPFAVLERALALVPGDGSLPRLATLATRARPETRTAGDVPFFRANGGPDRKGAVEFDRGDAQLLDGGEHVFDLSAGAFTMLAVLQLTDEVGQLFTTGVRERIVDFANHDGSRRIRVSRQVDKEFLYILGGCRSGNDPANHLLIPQEEWFVMLIRLYKNDGVQTVKFELLDMEYEPVEGSDAITTVCEAANTAADTMTTTKLGGGDSDTGNFYLAGDFAGFLAVDADLDDVQTRFLVAQMRAGRDTLGRCAVCPAGMTSPVGALDLAGCVPAPPCQAGYDGIPGACDPCVAGTFKSAAGLQACGPCAPGTAGRAVASTAPCPACPAGQIQTQAGQTTCVDCAAGTFREANSSAALPADCQACADFSSSPAGSARASSCQCIAGYLGD